MRPPRPEGPWFLLPTDPWGEAAIDTACFGRMLETAAGARAMEIERSIALADAVRSTILRHVRGVRPLIGPTCKAITPEESKRTWWAFGRITRLHEKYRRLITIAEQGLDAL